MISMIRFCVEAVLALIVMFYEWGWTSLARVFDWIAKLRAWAWLEARIAALPPYAALCVFVLPSILFLPVKVLAFWFIAQGQTLAGTALIIAAKFLGTAIVARLFKLTQPALMRLDWFAALYTRFKRWKDQWMALIRASYAWQRAQRLRIKLKGMIARARMAWRRQFHESPKHKQK
jgi:hypothetical protein